MLMVDIVVSNGQIKAAKPLRPTAVPIILQYTPEGTTAARLLWKRYHNDNMNERLADRTYGFFREGSNALAKARRIVNKHGGLDIAGEYGSIDIDDSDFVTG